MRALIAIGVVVALAGQDAPTVGTKSLDEWLDGWRAASREERDRIADGFVEGLQLNPNRAACDRIFELLRSSDATTREAACALLRFDFEDAGSIASTLEPLLADPDLNVRFRASATLLNVASPRPEWIYDALLDFAKGSDPSWQVKALRELSNHTSEPRVVDVVLEMVISFEKVEDPELRRRIVDVLASAEEERATEALRIVLHDGDESIRIRAATRLSAAHPEDDEVVAVLIELMRSSTPATRASVVPAISALGAVRGPEAISIVVAALQDPESGVRTNAAGTLGNLAFQEGLEIPDAVPLLVEMLKSEDGWEREAAAWALGHVGAETAVAVPALVPLIQDPHASARSFALASLKEAGPDVVIALPQLIAALEDPEPSTRIAVAQLIAQGGPRATNATSALILRLTDAVPMVRIWSAYALREIGASSAAAIPVLEKALAEDPEPKMRVESARTLAAYGPAAGASADALVAACKDPELDVRLWSLFALGELRVTNDGVLETLRSAAASTDVRVVAEANKSLARLGQQHDAASVANAPGDPVVAPVVSAPIVYDGFALVLSDAKGSAVIDFLDESSESRSDWSRNGVRYRFRYRAVGQDREITGEREVHIVMKKLRESSWDVDVTQCDLDLDAGSLHVGWSDRGRGSGNIKWRPEEMRVECADELQFETLDLLRFVR